MTDAQHIPTAMPSDTELLDALEAAGSQGALWVCHRATADPRSSVRLHEISLGSAKALGPDAYTTVRLALAVGLGLTKGD